MSVIGRFERIDGGFAVGWAYETERDSALPIIAMHDGRQVAETVTGGLRPDISVSGGPMEAGFELPLPASVLRLGGEVEIRAGGVSIGSKQISAPARVAELFAGTVVSHTNEVVSGWAVNLENPNVPVTLSIFLGARPIASCVTHSQLPEIQSQFGGRAPAGFRYPVPAFLRSGLPVLLRFFVANSSIELGGSPVILGRQPLVDRKSLMELGG